MQQTEQANLPKLFSVRRVAEQTSTGERTVREWIRRGRLKSVRLGGRVMVPESELRRVCEEGLDEPAVVLD